MPKYIDEPEKMHLECLIDNCGLPELLNAISEICEEKAAHILSSYNDNELSKDWQLIANRVSRLADRAEKMLP